MSITPPAARNPSPKSGLFAIAEAPEPSSRRLSALPRPAKLSLSKARERATRATGRLAGDPRVRLVFLFGSVASGDRAAVGDVDLGILTRPDLTLRQLLNLRAEVAAAAGSGVDLVSLNQASVALAWEVVRRGECLYAADPSEELEYVTRAWSRYWDFKPFLDAQWRLTGRRLEERLRRGSQT